MSTRSSYQDPRHLQLWLTFEWPAPAERLPVACSDCGWRGRRARRCATTRPCPGCGGRVERGRSAVPSRSNVVTLADRAVRPVNARRGRNGSRAASRE